MFRAALNNLFRKDSLPLYCDTMAKANFLKVFRLVTENPYGLDKHLP